MPHTYIKGINIYQLTNTHIMATVDYCTEKKYLSLVPILTI